MIPNYTAVVRSTGQNRYLDQLLGSLRDQTRPPDEVVIAIPRDVEPWPVTDPHVRFVHADRGMVSQRAEGILAAKNEHLLILDDDIVLDSTGAATLMDALVSRGAVCVIPYSTATWPEGGVKRWAYAFCGIAIPRRAGGVEYTAGGGYYYPLTAPPREGWTTRGGSGMVMALDRRFAIEKQALGDRELEKLSRYALREDGIFALRVVQSGGRCLLIPGVTYVDLGTSRHLSPGSLRTRYRAQIENHHYFWRHYIRPGYASSFSGRCWASLSVAWYLAGVCVLALAASLRVRTPEPLRGVASGLATVLRLAPSPS
jgi:hypothetical protein